MTFEAPMRTVPLTLYTELFIVRGTIQTQQHRVTDILNGADQAFLVLEDVSLEEFGSNELPTRTAFEFACVYGPMRTYASGQSALPFDLLERSSVHTWIQSATSACSRARSGWPSSSPSA